MNECGEWELSLQDEVKLLQYEIGMHSFYKFDPDQFIIEETYDGTRRLVSSILGFDFGTDIYDDEDAKEYSKNINFTQLLGLESNGTARSWFIGDVLESIVYNHVSDIVDDIDESVDVAGSAMFGVNLANRMLNIAKEVREAYDKYLFAVEELKAEGKQEEVKTSEPTSSDECYIYTPTIKVNGEQLYSRQLVKREEV
jgi:hypothetical protein